MYFSKSHLLKKVTLFTRKRNKDSICDFMKIDLVKGLNIEIGGEMGKHGTISLNNLVKLGKSLQELVTSLAKYTLESSVDLNNFELDLSGLKKCCTLLEIKYSPARQQVLADVDEQRLFVNDQLDNLLKISDSSDYLQLMDLYPDSLRRNFIVENLYSFTSSLGNAPVRFLNYDDSNKLVPVYKIRKFKAEIKNKLVSDIVSPIDETEPSECIGRIQLIKSPGKKPKKKVLDYYDTPNLCVAYNPTSIRYYSRNYIFMSDLMCEVTKEGNNIFIKNSMLDIIGVGNTQMEAEIDFAEEFDYIYRRYNELPDDKLSSNILTIKKLLSIYVKKIEE